MYDLNTFTRTVLHDAMKQKEAIIFDQLNELISRGLLVVEETQPVLVQKFESHRIELKQAVRLVLKDQEYIEKLEKENKELKAFVDQCLNLATGVQSNVRGDHKD